MSAPDALDHARRDLSVIPLFGAIKRATGYSCGCGSADCDQPAKHPIGRLVRNGLKNATTKEHVIRQWWSAMPHANIGIATGRVVVLDVDPRHGGDDALRDHERQHGELPPTWRSLTGGGGEHIFFAASPTAIRNSSGKVGPGLDIRGVGGYVVAPGSLHVSGRRYVWSVDHHPDDVPLAPIPDWLVEVASEPPATRHNGPPPEWHRIVADGVAEGRRNDTLARLVGHLLRRFVDPHVALELVLCWNSTRCRPPLDEAEVARTVNSIAQRELVRRGASP
jgi:Bifunctional DNA primase/polymerase, N-terminal/Primase C terminal 1 (PriCT-1)